MARFRKKPIEVEAEQWFPGKDVPGVTVETTKIHYSEDRGLYYASSCGWLKEPPAVAHVTTIQGQRVEIGPGEWVIREPDGEHYYPCHADVFAATYDAVD